MKITGTCPTLENVVCAKRSSPPVALEPAAPHSPAAAAVAAAALSPASTVEPDGLEARERAGSTPQPRLPVVCSCAAFGGTGGGAGRCRAA